MRLDDYLRRVGIRLAPNRRPADIETVRQLHVAHRETFLFENVSIQAGSPISVALADIEAKFLDGGQGGYCFEHNTLFAAVLADVGVPATTLLGRVRRGPPDRWCRTHMVLRVTIGGEPWLADVGFGALCLLEPIRLREGVAAHQVGFTYSLRRENQMWVLSCIGDGGSGDGDTEPIDLYEFSEDAQTPGDVEVANHYTSTHPDSIFRRTLTIQRTTRTDRTMLRQGVLTRYRDGRAEDEAIEPAQLPTVVRDVFGVELPPGPFLFEACEVPA
jgi:N-hydroxyarylamine O-acetyltransferase